MLKRSTYFDGQMTPAENCRNVIPGNADLPDGVCKALYIGTGGNVTLIAAGDTESVTFNNVPTGGYLLVQAKAVLSATTAEDIIALY